MVHVTKMHVMRTLQEKQKGNTAKQKHKKTKHKKTKHKQQNKHKRKRRQSLFSEDEDLRDFFTRIEELDSQEDTEYQTESD